MSGAGSSWQINNDLYTGAEAPRCTLVVTDGATVTNCTGYIGYGTGAHSNVVTIAGPGSWWHNSSNIYVGYQGWYNVPNIRDGAGSCCEDCIVGLYNNSSGNVVVIDGAGTCLDVRRWLMLGDTQARNILVVTNSALTPGECIGLIRVLHVGRTHGSGVQRTCGSGYISIRHKG